MRRFYLTPLLLLTVTFLASGCRQTAGPNAVGSASTMSPLTPLSAGQTPSLGPFGGSTRVTPPATGSFVAPNNYLGGTQTPTDVGTDINPLGAYVAPSAGNAIGSGVQVAGWNDVVTPTPLAAPAYGTSTSTNRDPRSGGMKVIDLTGARTPPGYRTPASNFNNNPPPTIPVPSSTWQQGGSIQGVLRPLSTPERGEIAGGDLTPLPPVTQEYPINPGLVDPSVPHTATAPPSTNPVGPNSSGSAQGLPWRQPGTRF